MNDPQVSEIVRETITELKKQSLSERLKNATLTLAATALGALMSLLFLSHWSDMKTKAELADKEVKDLKIAIEQQSTNYNTQLNVVIGRIAKLEAQKESSISIPLAEPSSSLQDWETSKEQIQKQIDKEVYRLEKRK